MDTATPAETGGAPARTDRDHLPRRRPPVTAAPPRLVILRGNSGSGKSTIAEALQKRYGRGLARIPQDVLRREILREHGSDQTPTAAPEFIVTMVQVALKAGYHVVVEGSLHTAVYGVVLRQLIAEHPGPSSTFWMDITFEETLRRHQSRPVPIPVSAEIMRGWFTPSDLLGVAGEQVIPQSHDIDTAVDTIMRTSGLSGAAPLTPCPVVCPRCAQKRADTSAAPEGRIP
jgi:predicted kinase